MIESYLTSDRASENELDAMEKEHDGFFGKDLLVIFRSLSQQSCFMSIFMNSY